MSLRSSKKNGPSTFSVPATGLYHFDFISPCQVLGSPNLRLELEINATAVDINWTYAGTPTVPFNITASISKQLRLTALDTVRVRGINTGPGGSTIIVIGTSPLIRHFDGRRVE